MGLFDNVSWSNPLGSGVVNSLGSGVFWNALNKGENTPWGPGGQKGLGGLSPTKGFYNNVVPGLSNFSDSAGKGVFDEEPEKPQFEDAKAFNPDEYVASDYSDTNRAGQEEIARGLSRNQNDIIAGNQKGGVLKSGSTVLNFSDALAGAQGHRQGLANNIGQMQFGDKANQYQNYLGGVNNRNQGIYNKYQDQMNKYSSNKQALGTVVGTGLSAALGRI